MCTVETISNIDQKVEPPDLGEKDTWLIGEEAGIRQLRTEEGDLYNWKCLDTLNDPLMKRLKPDIEWSSRSVQELAAEVGNYVVDVRSGRVPLSVIMMHTRWFLIPMRYQKLLRLVSLKVNNDMEWRKKNDWRWVIVSPKIERYMEKRKNEVIGFFLTLYGVVPSNLTIERENTSYFRQGINYQKSEETENFRINIDFKTILVSPEPEQAFFTLRRQWTLKQFKLVKRPRYHNSYVYSIVKQSYGVELFVGEHYHDQVRSEGPAKLFQSKRYFHAPLNEDMDLIRDEVLVKALVQEQIDFPPLKLSKMDPKLYSTYLPYYTYMTEENHGKIVKELIPYLKGPLVVPCDGAGTWANLWEGDGLFGDINYDGGRVKKETCYNTLIDAQQAYPEGCTIILMYCYAMLQDDEKELLEDCVLNKNFNLMIIDTTFAKPNVKMRALNNLVWVTENLNIPYLSAFAHDTEKNVRNVKYSTNLLTIDNPEFVSRSIYSDYWTLMRPLAKRQKDGSQVAVFKNLEEWFLNRASYKVGHYIASIGEFDPKIWTFQPHKRLFIRQIYEAPREWYEIVPHTFDKVQTLKSVYFSCSDEENSHAKFAGIQKNLSVNMLLQFVTRNKDQIMPCSTVLQVLQENPKRKMTLHEWQSTCFLHSLELDEIDLELHLGRIKNVTVTLERGTKLYEFRLK